MARKASAERAEKLVGSVAKAKKNIVLQYQGKDTTEEEILRAVRSNVAVKGLAEEDIESMDVYIKPEEHAVFYVVNGTIEGRVNL